MAVAGLFVGSAVFSSHGWEAWLPLLVFWLEVGLLTPLLGGSFGQVLTRVAVVHVDGRPVSLLVSLLRSLLICLVVPPVIYNRDRRGLHDLVTGTLTVRRSPGRPVRDRLSARCGSAPRRGSRCGSRPRSRPGRTPTSGRTGRRTRAPGRRCQLATNLSRQSRSVCA